MVSWKNLDTLASYAELAKVAKVDLPTVMAGENGGERVKKYTVPKIGRASCRERV